jgi:hypothetical protein
VRALHNGNALAFQARVAGSIPAARSSDKSALTSGVFLCLYRLFHVFASGRSRRTGTPSHRVQALKRIDHQARIVVCSATSDQSFVAGAASLGVEDYLNKPCDAERLHSALQRAIARRTPNRRPSLGAAAIFGVGAIANARKCVRSLFAARFVVW